METSGKENKRLTWSSKVEFMLTCIGYCVGLGNIWRFPYLCYSNGGGAFLIPYFIMLFLVGIPLLYMEFSFGQYVGLGPLTVWKMCPLFKGVGISYFLLNAYVVMYYTVIVAIAVFYLFASFTSTLPWIECYNPWNTPHCATDDGMPQISINQTINSTITVMGNSSLYGGFGNITSAAKRVSPAEEYLMRRVLGMHESDGISSLGGVRWELALCLLFIWTIVAFSVSNGIKTTGKVVYFAATFPYLMLTVLVIRGLTLPGAMMGIEYYLTPSWEHLSDTKVWYSAAVQIILSIGISFGTFLCFSSYNDFHNNTFRDAVITGLVNCLTSFYAGFAVFPMLGFMANQLGEDMENVVTSGPTLAFVVYPRALAAMPISPLWSALFFFMLFLVGADSVMMHVECLSTMLVDEFPEYLQHRRHFVGLGLCGTFFLLGLIFTTSGGMYAINLMDWYSVGLGVLVVGIVECVVINYVYGHKKFCNNIKEMLGKVPAWPWRICWLGVSPLIIAFVTAFMMSKASGLKYGEYVYPDWSNILGWLLASSTLVPIPCFMVYKLLQYDGSFVQRWITSTTSTLGDKHSRNRVKEEGKDEEKIMETDLMA